MSMQKTHKLGDLTSFERGLTYSKEDEVSVSEIGILRSNNVNLDSFSLDLSEVKFLRPDFDIPSNKKIKNNSILMCMSNGSKNHLGKVALVDKDINYAFGGFMGLLTPKTELIQPKYLYYALISPSFRNYVRSLSDGANINNLKYCDLSQFDIPILSLNEQNNVVQTLDNEFKRIDAVKRNAEVILTASKKLFLSTVESVFSSIKAKLYCISELASVSSGFSFKSSEFKLSGKYQVVRIGNVKQNDLRLDSSPVFVDDVADKTLSKSLLEVGDLLITQTGTKHKMDYGFVAKVDVPNLLLNQRVARVRFNNNRYLSKWFLYYSYTNSYKAQFFAHEGGTVGQGNVGVNAITDMLLPVPSDETLEQNLILLDEVSSRNELILKNYQETIVLCNDLKQALLRKFFYINKTGLA